MKYPFLIALLQCFLASIGAAAQSTAMGATAALGKALAFHASFDNGLNADFARGDRTLYSFSNSQQRAQGGIVGLPDDTIKITKGSGRFGSALLFTKKNPIKPFYKDGGNIGYNGSDWNRTVSVWLRLTPDLDLEPGYSDPLQIIGNDGNKGFIFLEFDKDTKPRHFRFAVRPLIEIWDPTRMGWTDMPYEKRPMVQVERAPFSQARWTHVVFTLEHINAKNTKPVASMYIDGELQGAITDWDLSFGWAADSAQIAFGSSYVGFLDEVSIFDRALSTPEVRTLHQLPNGVADLYKRDSAQPAATRK
jgi:hypothetical protein